MLQLDRLELRGRVPSGAEDAGRAPGLSEPCDRNASPAIAYAVATDLRLERVVPVADDLLVVRPRTAIGPSAVLFVWALILWRRPRRPPSSEP